MSTNGMRHLGRSVDFLSRLHDGELDAAERARFEAHRAHCAECRRAAIEFEDALAMFRSARSTPPRADLAARILRKVQSTNRRREPFPLGFRIDLGWAGLLAAALLALMITTPIAVRRQETTSPPLVPGPASEPAPGPQADVPADADERTESAGAPRQTRRESDISRERREAQAPPLVAAAPPAAPADARFAAKSSRQAPGDASASTAAAAPRAPASVAEESRAAAAAPRETGRIGGEGETVSPLAARGPWKLAIEPIDGFGPHPQVVSAPPAVAAGAGGRGYVVLVDSQGVVRKVSPHVDRNERAAIELRDESDGSDEVADSLAKLRFAPGNRPRRLLIRVE